MDFKRSIFRFSLIISFAVTTMGCGPSGPPLGKVQGKVTLDGQPLEGANVEFIPTSGRPSVGVTDANGDYYLQFTNDMAGALLGTHKVSITTARAGTDSEGVGPSVEARKELLPPNYHANTQLTAEVASGNNTFDFDLLSTGNDA